MRSPLPNQGSLLDALSGNKEFISVELRPPRIQGGAGMEDWIDTYHAIRRLTLKRSHVFITDNAVGRPEEENLRHLLANLGPDAPRSLITPFLTSKHPLDYCLNYAERAHNQGFRSLTVLGGDRHDQIPRCVEHAFMLRKMIRSRIPGMILGGWANPHQNARAQVRYLAHDDFSADFYLTQVVSHHSYEAVARFLEELDRHGIDQPGIFGVFYYRSARQRTLEILQRYFPVPVRPLTKEFEEEKANPDVVCSRSINSLRKLGATRFYISNLPVAEAWNRLNRIFEMASE